MPVRNGAEFSTNGLYRYRLWRVWAPGPRLGFIGLNPSTACAEHDDPTIRKCVGFAKRSGFGGIEVCNLFALRSRWPRALGEAADPVGPDNDSFLSKMSVRVAACVACWGNHGGLWGRDAVVEALMRSRRIQLKCLTVTAKGKPGHPLMLPYSAELTDFPGKQGCVGPGRTRGLSRVYNRTS